MSHFFDRVPLEKAQELSQLSRANYELRENCKQCLTPYGVESSVALHEAIAAGAVAEHPAYEHYLGTLLMTQARDAVREQLRAVSADLGGDHAAR